MSVGGGGVQGHGQPESSLSWSGKERAGKERKGRQERGIEGEF